jgi:hypothetical protein
VRRWSTLSGTSSEAAADVRGAAESEGASGFCAFCSIEQELLAWSCEGTPYTLDFLCPVGVTSSWEGPPPKGLYGAWGLGEALTGGVWREGDPGSKRWVTEGFAFAISPRSAAGRELTDGATSSVALFFFVSSPVERIGAAADGGRLMPPHSGFGRRRVPPLLTWAGASAAHLAALVSRQEHGEGRGISVKRRRLVGAPGNCWADPAGLRLAGAAVLQMRHAIRLRKR